MSEVAAAVPVPPSLRLRRSHRLPLLAYGLSLMALPAGLPAMALWSDAPDVALTMLLWGGAAAVVYVGMVLALGGETLRTELELTTEALEIRRSRLRPERVELREIDRIFFGPAGLVVWLRSGRTVHVGRAGWATPRLVVSLESRSGVPVEGWTARPD